MLRTLLHQLYVFMVTCLCLKVTRGMGKTIDEMIASASKDTSDFDFMADLDSPTVRLELDMVLTLDQYKSIMHESSSYQSEVKPRQKRKSIKPRNYRWTSAVIPYTIANTDFSGSEKDEIFKALKEWENYTCIRFTRSENQHRNFIHFQDGSGCSSYVGMSNGEHPISLAAGCRFRGIIAHEIGHAVGFFHEQNRPDRDEHITIQKENILSPNLYHNFDKYPLSAVDTYGVPYDYKSIMHYGGRAFSGNGQYTIKTRDSAYQGVIGNREGLSFNDIKLANLMYECNRQCNSDIRCHGEGFVGKDCNCWCPGNPVQKCDKTIVPVTTSRPSARSTVRPICQDMNKNCPKWANMSYCNTNKYVQTYCKQSCFLCNHTIPTTPPQCTDLKQSCGHWAKKGYCIGLYAIFMQQNCQASCDHCKKNDLLENRNIVAPLSHSLYLVLVSVIISLYSRYQ